MKILTKYELSSPTGYYSGSFLLFRLVLLYTSSYNWCRVWAISHPLSRICTLCAQSRGSGNDTNDVSVKTIQLQEGDPTKTAVISTGLDDK
jgi:hypothetical protein